MIKAANSGENAIAADALRGIARAFREKRRGRNSSYGRLAAALSEIANVSQCDLIRECPQCEQIFWAGRKDKEACATHSAAWRKREQRLRERKAKEQRARARARRKESTATKPFKLSITSATILDAVNERKQKLNSIADCCWLHLRADKWDHGGLAGKYKWMNILRGAKALVAAGFLTADEPDEFDDDEKDWYFTPTSKLGELRKEMLYPATKHHYFRYAVLDSAVHS